MEDTAERIATVIAPVKQDWKAVATLLLSALIFVSGVAWVVSGQILKGASRELDNNSKDVAILKSAQNATEQKALIVEKRMDELLLEIKSMNTKIGTVAESQARMEGYILGKNK